MLDAFRINDVVIPAQGYTHNLEDVPRLELNDDFLKKVANGKYSLYCRHCSRPRFGYLLGSLGDYVRNFVCKGTQWIL